MSTPVLVASCSFLAAGAVWFGLCAGTSVRPSESAVFCVASLSFALAAVALAFQIPS